MSRFFSIALAAAALSATAGCSNDSTKSSDSTGVIHTDSAGGLVVAPTTPYTETEASAPSTLVVTLAGSAPGATPPAAPLCAAETQETVFWVDGIRAGKPLPLERRYDLVSAACGLQPRMQATVVGGAINVFNDAGAHRLVFIRAGTTDTLQAMPFTNSGSLVATERLTKTAGIVEVRCVQHPQEKAHIAVFDHPYFGVAATGAKVTLDSVPAGDYRLLTWHEGMTTPSTVATKVGPSGQTEVVVR